MGKIPTEQTVDGVIRRDPSEVPGRHGFKRRGRNFHRRKGELVNSVWFQVWRGAPSTFCVNLTIIHPYHRYVAVGGPLPTSPSRDNSVSLASVRVSFEAGEGVSHWWVIRDETETPGIARQVGERVEASLPFFDELSTVDLLVEALEAGDERLAVRPIDLPILHVARGEIERALGLLKRLPAERLPEGAVDRLEEGPDRWNA